MSGVVIRNSSPTQLSVTDVRHRLTFSYIGLYVFVTMYVHSGLKCYSLGDNLRRLVDCMLCHKLWA